MSFNVADPATVMADLDPIAPTPVKTRSRRKKITVPVEPPAEMASSELLTQTTSPPPPPDPTPTSSVELASVPDAVLPPLPQSSPAQAKPRQTPKKETPLRERIEDWNNSTESFWMVQHIHEVPSEQGYHYKIKFKQRDLYNDHDWSDRFEDARVDRAVMRGEKIPSANDFWQRLQQQATKYWVDFLAPARVSVEHAGHTSAPAAHFSAAPSSVSSPARKNKRWRKNNKSS